MEAKTRTKFWMAMEDLFILLSIFALWPSILGWHGWTWEILKYAAVVGLIWIFVRRMKRYRTRSGGDSGAGWPGGPNAN